MIKRKALLISNTHWSIVNFRLPLVEQLEKRGYSVFSLSIDRIYLGRVEIDVSAKSCFNRRRGWSSLFRTILNVVCFVAHCYESVGIDQKIFVFTTSANFWVRLAELIRIGPKAEVIYTINGLGRFRSILTSFSGRFFFRLFFSECQLVFQNYSDYQLFHNSKSIYSPGSPLTDDEQTKLKNFSDKSFEPFTIGWIGRDVPSKGLSDFLRLPNLEENLVQDLSFLICTPDSFNCNLPTVERASGRSEFFSRINALYFPSRYGEGFPRVVIEALFSGCLVFVPKGLHWVPVDIVVAGVILEVRNERDLLQKVQAFRRLDRIERQRYLSALLAEVRVMFCKDKLLSGYLD